MNTEQERRQFRKRLVDLSNVELMRWLFLVNLTVKVETELLAFHALFDSEAALEPAPDTSQLAGIQLLIASEIKKRSNAGAKAKLKLLQTEGEEHTHANHAENGSH